VLITFTGFQVACAVSDGHICALAPVSPTTFDTTVVVNHTRNSRLPPSFSVTVSGPNAPWPVDASLATCFGQWAAPYADPQVVAVPLTLPTGFTLDWSPSTGDTIYYSVGPDFGQDCGITPISSPTVPEFYPNSGTSGVNSKLQ
jgi:hypothetical protein